MNLNYYNKISSTYFKCKNVAMLLYTNVLLLEFVKNNIIEKKKETPALQLSLSCEQYVEAQSSC